MVAPGVDLRHLRPLWWVSRNTARTAVLWQRWEQQVDGNTCANCWFSNPPSLLLPLDTEKSQNKQSRPLKASNVPLQSFISLFLSWPPKWSCVSLPLNRPLSPPCLHLLSHLCDAIVVQRLVLILPKLTEVHTLHCQLSCPSYYIFCPPTFPGGSCGPTWGLGKEVHSRVHLHHLCICGLRFSPFLDTVFPGESPQEGS